MRYYLDTNILAFLFSGNENQILESVLDVIFDYESTLLVSSMSVIELTHIIQTGKLNNERKKFAPNAKDLLPWLEERGIKIQQVSEKNIETLASLPLHGEHRDPWDRMIIAQAISDKIPLISSDHSFRFYEQDGLKLIFNKR